MDVEKVVKFIEDYAKSYIHYILSFFGSLSEPAKAARARKPTRAQIAAAEKAKAEAAKAAAAAAVAAEKAKAAVAVLGEQAKVASLDDGSLLIFGFFSALVGAALQGLFMEKLAFKDINFPQSVIVEVCYWLFLTLVFDFCLVVGSKRRGFSDALTVVLKVAPVAYVIGSYAAFVVYFATLALSTPDRAMWWASAAFAGVQVVLLIILLGRVTGAVHGHGGWRKGIASSVIVTIVAVVHLIVLLVTEPFDGKALRPAAKSTAAAVARTLALLATILLVFAVAAPGSAAAQDPPAATPAPAATQPGDNGVGDDCNLASGSLIPCAWHKGHLLLDGIFGSTPQPKPVPAPPHHDNRNFVLTTPPDEPNISQADLDTIDQAASYAKAGGHIKIELTGDPEDNGGADAYRRAAVIRQRLYDHGATAPILFEGGHTNPGGGAARVTQIDVTF